MPPSSTMKSLLLCSLLIFIIVLAEEPSNELNSTDVKLPKSQQISYEPKEEISHIFRPPEKRPPSVVSFFFTAVCLAPLGLLFVLWLRIGINFGNMPRSIWVPIFHASLAGLFYLYFAFWLKLNIFETLKYSALIGTIVFISGNRLLRVMSDQRKLKTN